MTNENETMEMLNVTADCRKKKCGLVKNSPECKLAYFIANCDTKHLKNGKTKDELISTISRACETKYGEKLVDFMEKYHLINLQQATVRQLQEYIQNHIVDSKTEEQKENTK